MSTAIGGYFELELPLGTGERYKEAGRYQSASAAFRALLKNERPARVWMPWYICSSMIAALQAEGVPIQRYEIDETLDIKGELPLAKGEWLVYVNYFGVCDRNVDRILTRYSPDQVVIDCAQAFFSAPRRCLATLYSPRKFFGVPDGGYLVTDIEMPFIDEEDDGSVNRCIHLLKRLGSGPEAGYQDYRAAESTLNNQSPRRMSQLTQRILASIDYERARATRSANFLYLHETLGELNSLSIHVEESAAPLCYPFFCAEEGLRERLIAERIYIPVYWPDFCAGDSESPKLEQQLSHDCLALPCDQRYSSEHMDQISHLIHEQSLPAGMAAVKEPVCRRI